MKHHKIKSNEEVQQFLEMIYFFFNFYFSIFDLALSLFAMFLSIYTKSAVNSICNEIAPKLF